MAVDGWRYGGALVLVLAVGCFRSASEPGGLGGDDDDCETVCFEWMEEFSRCDPHGVQPGRCPAGYACQLQPGDVVGVCWPEGPNVDAVFDLPRYGDEEVGVPVRFDWSANGRALPPPRPLPLGRALSRPYLTVHGLEPPFSRRDLFLGELDGTVRLTPGVYDVRYFLDFAPDVATDGRVPPPDRLGRLTVRAPGSVTLDWELATVNWTVRRADGDPIEGVDLVFESPGLLHPIGDGGPGHGSVLLPPGEYRVHARLAGESAGGSAELGRLTVEGDRTVDFVIQTQAVAGTVRLDGEPLRIEHLVAVFRNDRHQWEFPVDSSTGAYAATLVAGDYGVGFLSIVEPRGAYMPAGTRPLAPRMDIDAQRARLRGRLSFGGGSRPERWRAAHVLLTDRRGFEGGHLFYVGGFVASLDPAGSFELPLFGPQEYLVTFAAEGTFRRVPAYGEGFRVQGTTNATVEVPSAQPVDIDVAMARLSVSLTEDGEPIADDDPALARGVLVLFPTEWRSPLTPRQQLLFPGTGAMLATGRVVAGQYDLYFVRVPREGLELPPGTAHLDTLELARGDDVARSYDLRSGVLRGRLTVAGEDWDDDGAGRAGMAEVRGATGQVWLPTPVDADGRFEVRLLTGHYDLGLLRCDTYADCEAHRLSEFDPTVERWRLVERLAVVPER